MERAELKDALIQSLLRQVELLEELNVRLRGTDEEEESAEADDKPRVLGSSYYAPSPS